MLALFDISVSNIDCQYIDTFENIDIYKAILKKENLENIDTLKGTIKI